MFTKTIYNVTVSLILDKRRIARGGYPAKVAVSCKGVRKFFPSGTYFNNEEWGRLSTTRAEATIRKREQAKLLFERAVKIVEKLIALQKFDFRKVATYLETGDIADNTLNAHILLKATELQEEGKLGSAEACRSLYKMIEKYFGTLAISDCDLDFLLRLEEKLIGQGNSYTTVGIRMRTLRVIINSLIKKGEMLKESYPFKNYKIPSVVKRNIALPDDIISRILESRHLIKPRHVIYYDLFIMSYLSGGINMADLLLLKLSDVKDRFFSFQRQKTKNGVNKQVIEIALNHRSREIINTYSSSGNMYIFPFISSEMDVVSRRKKVAGVVKLVNTTMRELGMVLGIAEKITTYTARHTFATKMRNEGASIELIKDSLGHNSTKTTELYLGRFNIDKKAEFSEKLLQF